MNKILLYAFFWVISQRVNFICQRFGTLCLFHLHRQVGMKMKQIVPKRRHIKFRRREITQKKAYSIQNTEEVLNQEEYNFVYLRKYILHKLNLKLKINK